MNTEILQFLTVPVIAVAVYTVIEIINKATGENEKFKRFIPLLALILGVVMGVICFYALPEVLSATSLAMAVVMGGASGLAATGGDQVIKQFVKNKTNSTNEQSEEYADGEAITAEDLARTIAAEVLEQLKTEEAAEREQAK